MKLLRTRRLAVVGLVAAVVIVVVVALGGRGGGNDASGNDGEERTDTATAERRDLVDRESVEGTYGYGNERSVVNQLGDGGGGGGGDAMANDDSPLSGDGTYFASDEGNSPDHDGNDDDDECDDDQDDPNDDNVGDAPAGDSGASDDDDKNDNDDCDDDTNDNGDDRDGDDNNGNNGQQGSPRQQASPQQQGSPSGGTGSPAASGSPSSGGDGGGGGGDTNPEALTLTATARPGTIVGRGETLYRVDDDPVILMYGDTPAYRDMSPGIAKGHDVAQLEQNLVKLGYADKDAVKVDGTYTSATATAVRKWQKANGLPQTGTVEEGRIVFMNGARRAGSRQADLGSTLADGTEVMKTTSTTRLVKVELPVGKQSLVKDGDDVTVTLPGGEEVKGRIRSVGRVAHEADDSGDGGGGGGGGDPDQGGGESVLDMTVAPSSKKGLSRLDEAPVTVNLASESRKDALSVPVTALLAQAGGGYAVEKVDPATKAKTLTPVEPGLFAGGYVEIEDGSGIKEGDQVSVPAE